MTESSNDLRNMIAFVLTAIRYRWRLIAIPVFLIPVTVVLLGQHLGLKYKASCKALIQESMAVVPYQEVGRKTWTVRKSVPIVQNVLRSRTTIERVLGRMGHIDENTEPAMRDLMVADMLGKIDVYELGGGIVNISVVDKEAQVTYEVLNLLVEEMEDAIARPQSRSLEEASAFLRTQLEALRGSLLEIEENINRFQKAQASSKKKGRRHSMTLASYLEARDELLTSDKEIQTALWEKSKDDKTSQRPTDYLSKQMADARVKLGELTAIYTSNHPDVVELRNRIRSLRDAIRERDEQLSIAAGNGAVGASSDANQNGDDVITKDLLMMRDYDVKLKSYTTLLKKYEDARVAQALSMYDQDRQVMMIEEPRMPSAPLGPNNIILLAAGLILGVLLGFSVAIIVEGLSGRVKTIVEIDSIPNATFIGVLPHLVVPANKAAK